MIFWDSRLPFRCDLWAAPSTMPAEASRNRLYLTRRVGLSRNQGPVDGNVNHPSTRCCGAQQPPRFIPPLLRNHPSSPRRATAGSPLLPSQPTSAEFESALTIIRQVVGEGRPLTTDVAQSYEQLREWRERSGLSPLESAEYESPPPYSPYSPSQQPQHRTPTREYTQHSPGSAVSQAHSLSPVPDAIPNPPIPGDPVPTAEALFESVNRFAKENGFGIVRRNAYSYKGRKVRYTILCDRFGQTGPSKGVGMRQRKSRKCGCKWMVIAEALEEGRWVLRQHHDLEHSQHNHRASLRPSAHPSHRRVNTPIKETIEATSRRVGIRARDVRAVVQEKHPETVFTQRDIYNARALINREKLGGHTPTAALLKLFDEMEIPHLVKWADDEPNRLVGLVWTFPYCLQMWKRFPEVISFDNTYNTNRFKLPLFQATGQTCLGTVFNAAFGLIDNERKEGFLFLTESIRQLARQNSIREPDIIITDFDKQMKAALNDIFPEVQQQLCIHHINSNVLLKSKQRWIDAHGTASNSDSSDANDSTSEDQAELSAEDREFVQDSTSEQIPHSYRGVLMMWRLVVFAETEAAHNKAWQDLCEEFDDQRAILHYLYGTYMPVRRQWARCFIRKYRNFGIRVTSGTEASNNNVKSYLLNGMCHLYRLVEAMQDMVRDQERNFMDACASDEVLSCRASTGLSSDYLGELRSVMSSKALDLIRRQHRLARKAMPTRRNPFPKPLGNCNDNCSISIELGIPCCHRIYTKLASADPFTKCEVHPRWRLRPSSSQNIYRHILDPKIATALRGRPINTPQPIPPQLAIRDHASHLATQGGPGRRRGRPPGSRKQKTMARLATEATQHAVPVLSSLRRQTRSKSAALGFGRTTGVRASGRRTQPSIRRARSQWELLSSDEEVLPEIVVSTTPR